MELWQAAALITVLVLVFIVISFSPHPHGVVCHTRDADACGGNDLALIEVHGSNPCLAVRARVGEYETVFCIDTGFAGPCLLSLPCVVLQQSMRLGTEDDDGVRTWCDAAQQRLARSSASNDQQERALQEFLRRNRCSDFTSGCTMRLASIGTTKEQTSEILLTPPLELRTTEGTWSSPRACSGQPIAELLTSTPMPTLHLLTCDWLTQNAPALLLPHEGVLRTNMSTEAFGRERSTLTSISRELSGGSFVTTVRVQGVDMRVTVDSGAACYLSIGRASSEKMRECRASGKYMQQVGANGESICSQAVLATVAMAGEEVADVPVLVNDMDVDNEDGYLGICFLRHFDLCVTPHELFARRNNALFDITLLDSMMSERSCGASAPACAK